jgi:hypothetical protein
MITSGAVPGAGSSERKTRVTRGRFCKPQPVSRSDRLRAGAGAAAQGLRGNLCRLLRDSPSRQRRPVPLHGPRRRRSRHGRLVRVLWHRAAATVAASASARARAETGSRPALRSTSERAGESRSARSSGEQRGWPAAVRLTELPDVSNDGKEFEGFKEFELLSRREDQILQPPRVQVGGRHRLGTDRDAVPRIARLRLRIRLVPILAAMSGAPW